MEKKFFNQWVTREIFNPQPSFFSPFFWQAGDTITRVTGELGSVYLQELAGWDDDQ